MAAQLRAELRSLAIGYARKHGFGYTDRKTAILFDLDEGGWPSANLLQSSFSEILKPENKDWRDRLRAKRADEPRSNNSSDALLMSIFCHPGVRRSIGVAKLLGFRKLPEPQFGYMAKVAKQRSGDITEVDLRLDGLLVESKLTESEFQHKPASVVLSYRHFSATFHVDALPRDKGKYVSYQLIRNVLAARQHDSRFMLLYDARRPDLVQHWWPIVRAIKDVALRQRCGLITWQQIAAKSPREVRDFLALKYGIV